MLSLAPAVALAAAAAAFWGRAARVRHARRWSSELSRRARGLGRSTPLAVGLAVLLAAVALAGPRWGSRTVVTEAKGLNLILAIDISRSMLAEDASPSRLERAKREARRLVYDLGGDRIGLIAFAGQSFILSPLTVDGSALQLWIDALDPSLVSAGGTELEAPLSQGRDLLFAGDEVADRVLVVFSDGEAHDSLAGVEAAAERLKRDGVRLILVAEGGTEPARIPVRDPEGVFLGFQRDPADQIIETGGAARRRAERGGRRGGGRAGRRGARRSGGGGPRGDRRVQAHAAGDLHRSTRHLSSLAAAVRGGGGALGAYPDAPLHGPGRTRDAACGARLGGRPGAPQRR